MDKFRTDPPIYQGLQYAKEEFEQFYHRLKALAAQKILTYQDGDLSEKISTIKWQGVSEGELNLFKRYQEREGYFVPLEGVLYELSSFSAAVFFYNVQDFWLKRPFAEVLERGVVLIFQLKHKGKIESFRIPISKKFQVESSNPKVRPNVKAIQKLFFFVFGVGPRQQAQRVQELNDQIKQTFARSSPLIVEMPTRKLLFLSYDSEVLLWDQSTNLVFHYLVGPNFNLPFALPSFFDYIK